MKAKDLEIPGTVVAVINKGKCTTVVINTGKDYKGEDETIPVKFLGKNADSSASMQVGESVRAVGVEIGGHSYEGRFYPDIKAWKCERIGNAPKQELPKPVTAPPIAAQSSEAPAQSSDEDLQF